MIASGSFMRLRVVAEVLRVKGALPANLP